ncbi:hypothetical protein [Mesorhizobium sp. DCY119]|uniref:glycine-rich domain-containing protein n=1 Tax=Mesorhizobium sp. DCY119 TaxID=2108445 RepID=UPI000E6C5920|nr:hypothetical protein [Mesorhizobium sp. DCY119]RJG46430.1 hypothetical protein D3Y55_20765 [Mesorhizobium sp. DCY119]
MAVTQLTTSWLGYNQTTGRIEFWDGQRYRPLEEASDYAPAIHTHGMGDIVGLADALDAKLSRFGGAMTGPLEVPLVELGGTRLTGDSDDMYVWAFKVWHQGNDGAGSGLDADQLDGFDSGYFTNIPARLGYTPLNAAGGALGGTPLSGDGTSLYVNSVRVVTTANIPAGILRAQQTFIASGTWTKPTGIRRILVYCWGAGGGGGGAQGGASNGACGAGGGAGGFGWKWIDVSSIASVAVTIGTGGAAGSTAGGTGGTGGTTTFGSHISATGGTGGAGQTAGNFGQIVAGGSGGSASSGDFNVTGSPGAPGIRLDMQNGAAGRGAPAAMLAGGGNGFAGNSAGQAGFARGDGGGGGVVANSATGRAGGAGATGMVWVWMFE